MNLQEIFDKIDEDKTTNERALKELCSQSDRLNYNDLINRLKGITGDLPEYQWNSFVEWLVEDLENAKIVNEPCWDMTIEEIKKEYTDDTWEDEYEKYKNYEDFHFESMEDYKNEMMDWSFTYCLDGIFSGLEHEYNIRKEKGIIKN